MHPAVDTFFSTAVHIICLIDSIRLCFDAKWSFTACIACDGHHWMWAALAACFASLKSAIKALSCSVCRLFNDGDIVLTAGEYVYRMFARDWYYVKVAQWAFIEREFRLEREREIRLVSSHLVHCKRKSSISADHLLPAADHQFIPSSRLTLTSH